jgi:AcrR family transcriptional regulator
MNATEPSAAVEENARARLKRTALKLFAERGYRSVTVREIAAAAGQRNHGAVGYYFSAKENLAKELIVDGAIVIETYRNIMLDEMEARSEPLTVRDLVAAIVMPSAQVASDQPADQQYFNRFLADIAGNHPPLVLEALEDRWNVGYQRCLSGLRSLMPGMSLAEKNRRFVFLGAYVSSMLALREAMLADTSRGHPIWQAQSTLEDIIETAAAIVLAPAPVHRA